MILMAPPSTVPASAPEPFHRKPVPPAPEPTIRSPRPIQLPAPRENKRRKRSFSPSARLELVPPCCKRGRLPADPADSLKGQWPEQDLSSRHCHPDEAAPRA